VVTPARRKSPKTRFVRLNGFELGPPIIAPVSATGMMQAPMFVERRKSARRAINRLAHFHSDVSPLPRSCMVTDISENGARLYSEIPMPPTFTLALSGDGVSEQRRCRVVWQLGGELGVEFVDRRAAAAACR
jgi:hypothetical protein